MATTISKQVGKRVASIMALTALGAHLGAAESVFRSVEELTDELGESADLEGVGQAVADVLEKFDLLVDLVQSKMDAASNEMQVEGDDLQPSKESEAELLSNP